MVILIILIIDDDESIRKSLRLLLLAEGYDVETANDGGDALLKLVSLKPQILLLDIMMTPIDGLAFLKRLVERGEHKKYVIYVMTAMAGIEDELIEYQKKGIIKDYIVKPFVFSDRILEEIRSVIQPKKGGQIP